MSRLMMIWSFDSAMFSLVSVVKPLRSAILVSLSRKISRTYLSNL